MPPLLSRRLARLDSGSSKFPTKRCNETKVTRGVAKLQIAQMIFHRLRLTNLIKRPSRSSIDAHIWQYSVFSVPPLTNLHPKRCQAVDSGGEGRLQIENCKNANFELGEGRDARSARGKSCDKAQS